MPSPTPPCDTCGFARARAGARRRTPAGVVLVLLLALAVLVALPAPAAHADGAAVPAPSVTLPPELDLPVEYQGQSICSPSEKPGAKALKDLILRTYGSASVWIPRDCGVGGQSEHKEGRALDWMIGSAALRASANAFVEWVTAPDASGTPGAMARRMGIMYIGWADKIWRAYDTSRGWTELKGCFSKPGSGYDTYCHRDHVHVSMTWDGAAGLTSFWSGAATSVGACERRTGAVSVGAVGSADKAVTILNTAKGKGVAGGTACRLSADRWSGDGRRLSVALPVGAATTLRLRVKRLDANAPTTLRLSSTSGDSATVRAGQAPADVTLDVGGDGIVTADVDAGAAFVKVASLGPDTGAPPPPPAPPPTDPAPPPEPAAVKSRVSMSGPTYVRVGSPVTLSGTVSDPPAGAIVRRQVRENGAWVSIGKKATPADGAWTLTFTARETRLLRYRAVLVSGDATVSRSPRRDVRVLPTTADLTTRPIVTVDGPSFVRTGDTITLSGRVQSPPANASVQRVLRVNGRWQPLGDPVPVADGAWSMSVTAPSPRLLRYRAALLVGGDRVSLSPRADVRIVRR